MNAVERFPNEYQDFTRTTAVYPQNTPAQGLSYVALGLCDELGELYSASEDGLGNDLVAEAGDVYWYAARICDHLELKLSDVINGALYDGPAVVHHACTKAMLYGAIIAGRVKKIMRDGHLWSDDQRAAQERIIFEALRKCLAATNAVSLVAGAGYVEVMHRNMEKLGSRKERGVLQGDGDHR